MYNTVCAEMKGFLHHYPVPTTGIILHNLHSHLFGLMDTCNATAGKNMYLFPQVIENTSDIKGLSVCQIEAFTT